MEISVLFELEVLKMKKESVHKICQIMWKIRNSKQKAQEENSLNKTWKIFYYGMEWMICASTGFYLDVLFSVLLLELFTGTDLFSLFIVIH